MFRPTLSILFLFLLPFFFSLQAQTDQPGYKKQALDPLGGEITMPDDWHYQGGMTPNGFLYIFSKEKNENGSYETGFRIQGFVGVQKNTQLTPKAFCFANRDKFKNAAKKIVRECGEEEAGFFRKTCLETIEKNPNNPSDDFHIIYSFFWNEKSDMAVVSIFGAPESKWPEAEKIYRVMQEARLIDPAKIEAAAAKEASP